MKNTKENVYSYLKEFEPETNIYPMKAPMNCEFLLIIFDRVSSKISFLVVRNETYKFTIWTKTQTELEEKLTNLGKHLTNTKIIGINSQQIIDIKTDFDRKEMVFSAIIEVALKFKD